MKLKSSFIRFLKNVGYGFIGLSAAVAMPSLTFLGAAFIGHQVMLVTSSALWGVIVAMIMVLLIMSIAITLFLSLIKRIPFE